MIRDLDTSLKHMFAGEAASGSELATASISFAVPDQRWRGTGTGLELNVYLYRVSENRELRSNERARRIENGMVITDEPAARVECSYLLTAWNKGQPVSGMELEEQEHRLLSQVLDVLLRNRTLPRRHLTGLAAQALDLPMVSAESDGIGANGEFWTGLGTYLRPSITCRVTLALAPVPSVAGPAVSTLGVAVDGDGPLFVIGGTVRRADPPSVGIAGAWVRVAATGTTAVTDADGRFVLTGVAGGTYPVAVRAVGFREASRQVLVPSATGTYDLMLEPL